MLFAAILLSDSLIEQLAGTTFPSNELKLPQSAPTQPVDYYDYFGKLLSAHEYILLR